MNSVGSSRPLLSAERLSKTFVSKRMFRRARQVQAVHQVDLAIGRGESVGVVGESGSGKSTLGRLLLGLLAPSAGAVKFDGADLAAAGTSEWRRLRQRMQIVFQDPYGSLDPRRRIGAQIGDGLAIHGVVLAADQAARVAELLLLAGLDPSHAERFPHEFSGGQRQRAGIARALATRPDFLVADEPVSALDVSIQAQIIELLATLKRDLNLTLLFISHDLLVVRHLAQRVIVMYLGRIMEEGDAAEVFDAPAHPYTRALLSATPQVERSRRVKRILLPGDPPSPSDPPSGCVFRTRCAHAQPACAESVPALRPFNGARRVACHLAEQLA